MNRKLGIIAIVLVCFFVFSAPVSAQTKVPKFPYREEVKAWLAELEESFNEALGALEERVVALEEGVESLEGRVSQNEEDIEGLQSSSAKQLKVYDFNDQYLGLLVDANFGFETFAIFSEDLGKIVRLSDVGEVGPLNQVYFESSDCSGTPYNVVGTETTDINHHDDVVRSFSGDYYYYDHSDGEKTLTVESKVISSGCQTLSPETKSRMVKLIETDYPFDDPIQVPYDVRYE